MRGRRVGGRGRGGRVARGGRGRGTGTRVGRGCSSQERWKAVDDLSADIPAVAPSFSQQLGPRIQRQCHLISLLSFLMTQSFKC